jgi:hypothetical protein
MCMAYSNMWGDVCKKDGCGPVRHSQMYVLESRFLTEAGHGLARAENQTLNLFGGYDNMGS